MGVPVTGSHRLRGRMRVAAALAGPYQVLPRAADDQRTQMVRRLAAQDDGIDVLGPDVTWTPEFASAGWILECTGERNSEAEKGTPGPHRWSRPATGTSCTPRRRTPTPKH
jgi:hypothetical protein